MAVGTGALENLEGLKKLTECYQGKRVFLTGHTGFKGTWLLKLLNELGAEVYGYALAPESGSTMYRSINGDSLCRSAIGDIRDRDRLIGNLKQARPEFVFHLAAQPLVRKSYEIPAETFEVNVIGTANVLDAVKELDNTCNVVAITTDKVYHNEEWAHPYRETDRLGGYDPYSASKACAELVIDSYRNSFFNASDYSEHRKAVAVGRAGNVIGGGDFSTDRLVPDIAKHLKDNRPVPVRNPVSVRPWQHVLEPLVGYLFLGAKLAEEPARFSQAYNFGPANEDVLTVKQLVESAIGAWGNGQYEIASSATDPHEAGLLKLDISKARSELGWAPRMNSAAAINKTIAWYRTFFDDPKSIISFTENQISEYLGQWQ